MMQPPHNTNARKLAVTLALSVLAATALFSTSSAEGGADMVTLCHATGSESNPFVTVTTSAAGAFNGHLGSDHQNGEDIIPPFEHKGQTHSQNWDAAHQAIFDDDCGAGAGCSDPCGGGERVTLCHATGSESNPFVTITVSSSGAFNGHLGSDHQNGEDIIPPFEHDGTTYSQNWDAAHQAILENDCEPVPTSSSSSTTPPSETSTTTPPPSETNTTTPPPETNTTTPPPSTTPPAEIPVFPSWSALALGVVGALGSALAVFRRKLP